MAIELPSGPAVLEERLAALEDPVLAERLFRENPSLFVAADPEPPCTQREILRWTTRRVGTAVIAVTAAISIVAGYVGSELGRNRAPVARPAQHAAVVVPLAHRAPVAHRTPPRAHVAHHAAAPPHPRHVAAVTPHAAYVAPAIVYRAPVVYPRPDREAQLLRARLHAQELEVARLRALAAAEHAAARAAQARAAAHHRIATAPASAPQSRPQSEPAAATRTATATGAGSEPAGQAGAGPANEPLPESTGGVKTPPTNPGGVWNERYPGGTLGGMIPPIPVGVPRDSCTPRGGRIGAVTQVLQAAAIIQSLSRR
jgi:hypothetical protein